MTAVKGLNDEANERTTRERVLESAERRAIEVGIGRVRVGQVAADAGVSRQTVYNEFGDKWGVARALAARVADRLLDEVEVEMAHCATPAEAVSEAMAYCLRSAARQPLIQDALSREKGDDMLALVTTDLDHVIELAETRVVNAAMRLWPYLDRTELELGTEVVVRLALSHIVCPTEPVEVAARKAAKVVGALLGRTPAP